MKTRAQREVYVPKDWHQEWLEDFLNEVYDAMGMMNSLANKARGISRKLSDRDISLDVDGALDRIIRALNKASDVLEDEFNYLDTSELEDE